jgi:hypothetical protein
MRRGSARQQPLETDPASATFPVRRTPAEPSDWSPQWVAWVLGGTPRALLALGELATLLNKNPRTIKRWVRSGKLKAVRLTAGKTAPMAFNLADVRRFLGLE